MLQFVQQFQIMAVIARELLYLVQDFKSSRLSRNLPQPQPQPNLSMKY